MNLSGSDSSGVCMLILIRSGLGCRKGGGSFLSRIMGSSLKKKNGEGDDDDVARTDGMDAHVFSQPIGYTPTFPAPPKYIRVCVLVVIEGGILLM